jgi:DNA-binding MarR family transcriptional regulator
MLVLWEQDHINVSDICEQLLLETPTLTPLLKRLETRGLIDRKRSSTDERQVMVTLTEAGHALRQRAEGIPECVAQAVGCSLEEIVMLREQLVKLRGNLFKDGG